MKKRRGNAIFWLKGLAWLLAIMFLFTVVSKAADSLTVARVSVSSPSSRKIQYSVSAEGRIEKNREISVLTQPDILVDSMLVSVGQRVKKGEVLAKLDMEHLQERIDGVNREKEVLELQNRAARQNEVREREKQELELARAEADYRLVRKKNKAAVAQAKKELVRAKKELRQGRKKMRDEMSGQNASDKTGAVNQDAQDKATAVDQNSVDQNAVDQNALEEAVAEKRKAYEDARETGRSEEKAAKRAVEDARSAKSSFATDSTIGVNNIAIQDLELQLGKLKKIKKQGGQIVAPKDGVITSVQVDVGQKTADTGMFGMTDDSTGVKFVGQMMPADAKYVSAGDVVSLHTAARDMEDVSVTSVETDEGKEFVNVTALLPADSFSLGETVSMDVVRESGTYPCTVPVTAVHQENGRSYVYLVQTEDTILGEREIARKMDVTVLEKNETIAALEDGTLTDESRIITDMDRYVEAGDRVRLKE